MHHKINIWIIISLIFISMAVVFAISWFFIPGWQRSSGGIWVLIGLVVGGVITIIRGLVGIFKDLGFIRKRRELEADRLNNSLIKNLKQQGGINIAARNVNVKRIKGTHIDHPEIYINTANILTTKRDIIHTGILYKYPDVIKKECLKSDINYPQETARDTWFYGRNKELALIQSILNNDEDKVKCVCVYGFGGVGKSRFLGESLRLAENRKLKIIGNRVNTVGPYETLAEFVLRIDRKNAIYNSFKNDYEVLSDFTKKHFNSDFIIAIDEFRVKDERFVADFNWFLGSIPSIDHKIIILTASRQKPFLKATLPILYLQLDPFSNEDTKILVDHWAKDNKLIKNSKKIFDISGGYPQLVEYICHNPRIVKDILKGIRIEFDILKETWIQIRDEKISKAIMLFSAINRYYKEISEEFLDSLMEEWPVFKDQLLDRSLIKTISPKVYKIHDLLSDYVYNVIGKKNRQKLHKQLGFFLLYDRTFYDPLYAFYHLSETEDISNAKIAHSKIRNILRFHSYSKIKEKSIRRFICLIGNNDLEFLTELQQDLGFVLCLIDEYDAAEQEFLKAIRVSKSIVDDGSLVWSYYGLGIIYRMRADFPNALKYFEDSEVIFNKLNDKMGISWALREKSEILRSLGRYDEAKSAAIQSLEISDSTKDQLNLVANLRIIADMELIQCNFNKSLDIYERALNQSKEIGSIMNEAYILNAISNVLKLIGKSSEAIGYSIQSINLLKTIDDKAGLCFSKFSHAEALRLHGELGNAEREYKSARNLAKKIQHIDFELFSMLGLGELSRTKKQIPEALKIFQYILSKAKKCRLKLIEAHALLSIAETARIQNVFDKDSYDKALSLYSSMKSKLGMVNTLVRQHLSAKRSGIINPNYINKAREVNSDYSKYLVSILDSHEFDKLLPLCYAIT